MCDQISLGKVTFRNVVVRGFGCSLNDKQLRVYFGDNVGDVESAKVATFGNGVSKGYGYVCFYSSEDAARAVREINGKKLHGYTLLVEEFKSEEQRNQELLRSVDVEGFAESLNEKSLRGLFARFGEIEYSKVERDINGSSWGLGYVCFSKREDAQRAARMMNGYKLGPVSLTVELRDEKQKKLKNKQLHIRNLQDSVNEVELKKLFEPHGKIRICHVDPSPREGVKQGYVCFSTEKEADEAIDKLNRRLYKGRKLLVDVQQTKQNYKRVSESEVDKVLPEASLPRSMRRRNVAHNESTNESDTSRALPMNQTNLRNIKKSSTASDPDSLEKPSNGLLMDFSCKYNCSGDDSNLDVNWRLGNNVNLKPTFLVVMLLIFLVVILAIVSKLNGIIGFVRAVYKAAKQNSNLF